MKNPFKNKSDKDVNVVYAEFLQNNSYMYSIDTWVPLFEDVTKNVFDVQIVPIVNLKVTMDGDEYIKAYGQNGEFIITAKDNSKQVVIDYQTGVATIFTGGIIYIISQEDTKKHTNEYR